MKLSRRHFVAVTAASAGFACVPGSAKAVMALPFRARDLWPLIEEADAKTLKRLEGKRITLTGYLSRDEKGYALSRLPRHCDYCYLGSARSVLRVEWKQFPLSPGFVTLTGRFESHILLEVTINV